MNAAGSKLGAELETVASPENGVQIWMANLDAILPNEMDELTTSLNPGERARASRFHFERDGQRFSAARGILRQLLSAALSIPASEIIFEYGRHGKPAIAQTLRFNISHAAGLAIFALAWNRQVGIDIEASERLKRDPAELPTLARRILSPREFTIWHALPNDTEREKVLLRAWTGKEAYLKATGEGLSDRLTAIEVILDTANPLPSLKLNSLEEGKIAREWTLYDLPASAGFISAMALESATPQPFD